eukprot:3574449-Rhodomonas_salina.1
MVKNVEANAEMIEGGGGKIRPMDLDWTNSKLAVPRVDLVNSAVSVQARLAEPASDVASGAARPSAQTSSTSRTSSAPSWSATPSGARGGFDERH